MSWLSRRLNMKLALTSTIFARSISCWMDPRRWPVCWMVPGVLHLHTVEVKEFLNLPYHKYNICTYFCSLLTVFPARCLIPAERSRVVIGGMKRWPFDVTDAMVPHGENVTFYCKHPHKQCSFISTQTCFDGKLQLPDCYIGNPGPPITTSWFYFDLFHKGGDFWSSHSPSLCFPEPAWLQYKLFTHRIVSEIDPCEPGDVITWIPVIDP